MTTFLVQTPTVFGTGDGTTSAFKIGQEYQQVTGVTVETVRRVDWQGDTLLTTSPRTNLLSWSQDFDNAAWAKSASSITQDVISAPDGTVTADALVETFGVTAANHNINRTQSFVAGSRYSLSMYAKEFASGVGAKRYLLLSLGVAAFGTNMICCFDLATGQSVSSGGATASMALVGGYYRCSVSGTATTTTSIAVQLRLVPAFTAAGQTYIGDGVSGLYVWGVQLEVSNTPTAYIPTTSNATTVADYSVVQPDTISMGQIPAVGAVLRWTGRYEYTQLERPPQLDIITVASQYANSPTLMQMINSMAQYFDPRADMRTFYDYVWNVDTAQGFGLDIWGRIVGVDRNLTVPNTALDVFGFDQGDDEPFGQAPFYASQPTTVTYTLDDVSYRKLILVKALSNISICSAQSINQQLRNLFPGRGKCYVIDSLDMSMTLTFEFELAAFEISILTKSNAITRPAAVDVVVTSALGNNLGFKQGDGEPFNQGTFYTIG